MICGDQCTLLVGNWLGHIQILAKKIIVKKMKYKNTGKMNNNKKRKK